MIECMVRLRFEILFYVVMTISSTSFGRLEIIKCIITESYRIVIKTCGEVKWIGELRDERIRYMNK